MNDVCDDGEERLDCLVHRGVMEYVHLTFALPLPCDRTLTLDHLTRLSLGCMFVDSI